MNHHEYWTDEIIEEIKIFMPKLIQVCERVGDLLYEPMTEQSWLQFGDMVEGINDLYKTLNEIHIEWKNAIGYHAQQPCIVRALESIKIDFQAMNKCMDEEDFVGASDSIRYELISVFHQLIVELGEVKGIKEKRFAANMQYLKKSYPQVYREIHSQSVDHQHYQVVYARNGMPILSITADDTKPLFMYSQFDPTSEVKRWVDRIAGKVQNKSKILIYGLGFGYHVEGYVDSYAEHNVLIYEPDVQILLAAMSVIDIKQLFYKRNIIDFVVGTSKSTVDELLQIFNQSNKGEPEIITYPIYETMKNMEFKLFFDYAERIILQHINIVFNYKKFGVEWTKNSMYNFKHVFTSPSISGLENRLNGMTAVIAGAGPSLEADIEWLRKLKNHAFIIAAGTAIQSLLHYGIEPHLIVSIDGSQANYRAFQHLDTNHIPLLFAPMIEHRIIDNRANRLIHCHLIGDTTVQHFMDLKEEDSPVFRSTHSVTGTAIQAAIYMGCKEIVFTGQDLSYPNEQVYASGAKHLSDQESESTVREAKLTVENVRGSQNRTNNGMRMTLADIEVLLGENPEIIFVNTSQMGAKIKQTIWQSMEDVLLRSQGHIVKDDFFIEELASLQRYDKQRVSEIYDGIAQLPEELSVCEKRLIQINNKIDRLTEFSRTNLKKCISTIGTIDSEWEIVSNSSPFKGLFWRACGGELKQFEIDLLRLNAETTVRDQVSFYRNSMQPLVRAMLDRCAELTAIVIGSKQRIEEVMGDFT